MKKLYGSMAVLLAVALAFSGCVLRPAPEESRPEPASSAIAAPAPNPEPETSSGPDTQVLPIEPQEDTGPSYIEEVAQDTIARFLQPGMSEYEMAKAAFDYIIETTSLTDPVGLELWRIRGSGSTQPSFAENRSLSVLLYGAGMCEDYAAALTMLLRGMGLEAEYVPGLTYAANGSGLVDHAWTVAKIDGVWYHLDCQLEGNVSRHDTIRYRYFMKSDATLYASHRWGQNLIDSGLLTAEQNGEIARDFIYEPCPQDYPTPPPLSFTHAPMPDVSALKTAIDAEIAAYENIHGPLSPLELNIIPPVFALEGYPPA